VDAGLDRYLAWVASETVGPTRKGSE